LKKRSKKLLSVRRRVRDRQSSVPQAVHDLLSLVCAADENGEDTDFGRPIIDLEVEDKIPAGHGANARPAPVGMGGEGPDIGKGFFDSGRRSIDSAGEVIAEFLVGPDEMFLDAIKFACDIRRAADPIRPHPCCACA
jgi:hypothetical protein